MAQHSNKNTCTKVCWLVATFVGIVSIVMLYLVGGFGGNQAVFIGALVGLVLGTVLTLFVCRDQTSAAALASDEKPAQRYAREAEERRAHRSAAVASGAGAGTATAAATPSSVMSAPAPAADTSAGSTVKPSAHLSGEADLAARKGSWKYEQDGDAAQAAPETKAMAAAPAAAASDGDASDGGAAESAPALMKEPRTGGADDLKLISGVGPKLEETLNDMGIWHFDQVAKWGPSEIAWVDERLRFKGRIERDDWMSQAKILAEGGETEFSKKKKG